MHPPALARHPETIHQWSQISVQRHIDGVFDEYQCWLADNLTAEPRTYVQVLAAFITDQSATPAAEEPV